MLNQNKQQNPLDNKQTNKKFHESLRHLEEHPSKETHPAAYGLTTHSARTHVTTHSAQDWAETLGYQKSMVSLTAYLGRE